MDAIAPAAEVGVVRVAVHDYAGHPFQFELSRALAARGHLVRHFFFADDPGPKGASTVGPDDPATFSVDPISLGVEYRKDKFIRRFLTDYRYGLLAAQRIRAFKPDVVISGNTPLDAQRAIQQAAFVCNARFVFWVQDFYGIAIERLLSARWKGLGAIVARYYRAMENRLLTRSSAIVLISPDFQQYLPKTVAPGSVAVIRNWGALSVIQPEEKHNAWSAKHGLGDAFVFMYTGTLALKHDPNLLLALCDAFRDDPAVQVVVTAAGVNADKLKAMNAGSPRANLTILPLQPSEVFARVLGTADVLVALLEGDAAKFSVPSKLLSYLCAGRAILLSAPSENLSTRVLEESGAGLSVDAADASAFVAAAQQLRADGQARRRMAAAGRSYAEAHFDIGRIAEQFERAAKIKPLARESRIVPESGFVAARESA